MIAIFKDNNMSIVQFSASSYLLAEEFGLTSEGEAIEGGEECGTRLRREPDAHSLITMLGKLSNHKSPVLSGQ